MIRDSSSCAISLPSLLFWDYHILAVIFGLHKLLIWGGSILRPEGVEVPDGVLVGERLERAEEAFARVFLKGFYGMSRLLLRLVELNSSNSSLFLVFYDFRP